jgi:hypothetical protein
MRFRLAAIAFILAIVSAPAQIWIPAKQYSLGSMTYSIPDSFKIAHDQNESGEITYIALNAPLPSSSDTIRIGIIRGALVSIERRMRSLQQLTAAEIKTNECGIEYRSGKPAHERWGHNYFLKKFDDAELSIVRCPKESSSGALCDSRETMKDGNTVLYTFPHGKICDWHKTRTDVLSLIDTFRK